MLRIKYLVAFAVALGLLSLPVFANDDIYKVSNYVPNKGLVLYAEAKLNSRPIATIPPDTSWIKLQGNAKAGWQKISWNNQQGWVKAGNLELDRAATNISKGTTDCLHDPSVKNKACCGIVETTNDPSELVKIYSVTGISKNKLLAINSAPGKRENIVSLAPHNATWIMKLNKKRSRNGITWEKVKWGSIVGWVDGRNIQFSPELTAVNDTKRKACNQVEGCEPDLSALSATSGRKKLR